MTSEPTGRATRSSRSGTSCGSAWRRPVITARTSITRNGNPVPSTTHRRRLQSRTDARRRLHPRPPRQRAAVAPVADRGQLRRLPAAAPAARATPCSTSAADRAPSPPTWWPPWRRDASSRSTARRRARGGSDCCARRRRTARRRLRPRPADGDVRRDPRAPGAPAPHRPGGRAGRDAPRHPPGGLVAARDADYGAFTWWPRAARAGRVAGPLPPGRPVNGAEPDAGRRLLAGRTPPGSPT